MLLRESKKRSSWSRPCLVDFSVGGASNLFLNFDRPVGVDMAPQNINLYTDAATKAVDPANIVSWSKTGPQQLEIIVDANPAAVVAIECDNNPSGAVGGSLVGYAVL